MIEFIQLTNDQIIPSIDEITVGQGIPKGTFIKDNIKNLIDKSVNFFLTEATPSCIIKEISKDEFDTVFVGDGNNEEEAPLSNIFPQADYLFLFALTMGSTISQRIEKLFSDNDFALGSMLDTTASLAADKSVEFLENHITSKLSKTKLIKNNNIVLSYSPGYCGWHISAQKKLFSYLHPEQIGILLNESCLMTPLKSVTGVLIAGDKNIHDFENSFSFCYNCKVQSCIERKDKILNH